MLHIQVKCAATPRHGLVHHGPMNPSLIEAKVLAAISAARSGTPAEDTFMEFKSEWPTQAKSRQLAAAANGAGGHPITYVIGCDDHGAIGALGDVDPADWWQAIEARFDEVAPELALHLRIQVDNDSHVIALVFNSDRAPYVVTREGGGSPEREIPIRAATGTRSAHRREILQMLLPQVARPAISLVAGSFQAGGTEYYGSDSKDVFELRFGAKLYFDLPRNERVFLPSHQSSATASSGALTTPATPFYFTQDNGSGLEPGVHYRNDGLELHGPGVAYLSASWKFPRAEFDAWAARETVGVSIELPLSGSVVPLRSVLSFGSRTVSPVPAHYDTRTDLPTVFWTAGPA